MNTFDTQLLPHLLFHLITFAAVDDVLFGRLQRAQDSAGGLQKMIACVWANDEVNKRRFYKKEMNHDGWGNRTRGLNTQEPQIREVNPRIDVTTHLHAGVVDEADAAGLCHSHAEWRRNAGEEREDLNVEVRSGSVRVCVGVDRMKFRHCVKLSKTVVLTITSVRLSTFLTIITVDVERAR